MKLFCKLEVDLGPTAPGFPGHGLSCPPWGFTSVTVTARTERPRSGEVSRAGHLRRQGAAGWFPGLRDSGDRVSFRGEENALSGPQWQLHSCVAARTPLNCTL